jgi:chondroitin 4-sulfotransferase 11
MGICHKFKCVFVCIPKTATSTISSMLQNTTDQNIHSHDSYMDMIGNNDNDLMESYFSFTFVREPFDRAVSIYHQLSRGWDEVRRLDFKEFIQQIPESKVTGNSNQYGWQDDICLRSQFRFVSIKNVVLVDEVYRFENLESDWKKCVQRINSNMCDVGYKLHSGNLRKENSSDRIIDLPVYYDRPTFERVYQLYAKDFELFHYPKVIKDSQGNVVFGHEV